MPGLTIATDSAPGRESGTHSSVRQPQSPPRSASPTRPPVSPITPTLPSAHLSSARFRPNSPPRRAPSQSQPQPQSQSRSQSQAQSQAPSQTRSQPQSQPQPQPDIPSFAADRQTYTQARLVPDASITAIPPPAPVPIDFDANPDVLALESAITILQMQRQRAINDIRTLGAAKDAAIADPAAFLADLTAGRLRNQSDPLFAAAAPGSGPRGTPLGGSSSSSSDEEDEDHMDVDGQQQQQQQQQQPASGSTATRQKSREKKQQRTTNTKKNDATTTEPAEPSSQPAQPPPAWSELPQPQNVVRCPPINWSQYAVVGESLDKLHAEQLRRPDQGQPAVLGPGGTYDFRAAGDPNPTEFVGVAAPYNPSKDKIEKKPRGDPKR